MSLASALTEQSNKKDYEKANAMPWVLALWLPPDIYRSLGNALSKPDAKTNPLSVVVDVRTILLGNEAGDLTSEEIIHHAPSIGTTAS